MKTRFLTAVLIAAGFCALQAQDWNQWRGASRTGTAAAFTPPAQWPDKPTRAWRITVGEGHSSPVVSGARAFVFSRLGEQEVVTAVDLKSGKQLWQQKHDAPYTIYPPARFHGKGPKSTPVIAGDRLFTFGISGIVSALDLGSGRVLWRRHFVKEFDATSPDFGVAASPIVDGSSVIVHVGGNKSGALTALDVASGATRWQWKGDGPGYASPVVATIGGVRHLITQSRSNVVGISAADGALLWRIALTTEYDQNIVTPVVLDDVVVYSGIERPLTAVRVSNVGGKWVTKMVWENAAVPMYMSSPVAHGGQIYGLTHRNKGQFFAVDARTGKTLWTTRGREAENAGLVAAGNLILATTTEAELIVFRADPAKFDLVKRYTIAESPVWAHPVPAGRGVLIKDAETLAYWLF